eukprot:364692-Chlamydomonas_euryale.AAC.12
MEWRLPQLHWCKPAIIAFALPGTKNPHALRAARRSLPSPLRFPLRMPPSRSAPSCSRCAAACATRLARRGR